ncbi:MAG: tRNA lysidine(34) synthetase TilS [Gordonia sp. (in: high G+C Gram-positive bacteria)]
MIGAVRGFVRRHLSSPRARRPRVVPGSATQAQDRSAERVCVALSGGPDSLALTAAAVRAGLDVTALVVDHGLQDGSARAAERAAEAARGLGARARVLRIEVCGPGGPEAAARRGRYAALDAARDDRPVLLGHTLDDQAETVLLGLGRGSGARSLAGMAEWADPWGRPLLGIRRGQTRRACAEWGLNPWHDPQNDDPRFTRVRLRHEALPLLDDVLHGGVAEALARTAAQLRADAEALDSLAAGLLVRARTPDGLDAAELAAAPAALRTRALRAWLVEAGASAPSSRMMARVDALIADWHGQGPVAVGGDAATRLVVARRSHVLTVENAGR